QWGILLGSDNAQILSNTIFDVDYAIYVPDSGSLPGVSSSAGTIYDTTAWGSAMGRIRLSPTFQGTVVDLGSGIRSTDLSAVVLQTSGPATRIAYAWSGRTLNVSATVGAAVAFATASTPESQALPFIFPLIAVALLWASSLVVRWTRRQSGDAERDELERNDWESDDPDSNADP